MIERIDIELPAEAAKPAEQGERARQQLEQAAVKAKEEGHNIMLNQKQRVASELRAYSEAARRAAGRLEGESDLHLSRYVNGAAERLESLSRQVEERDLGEIWDDLESMARRRPEIYFGGMFVAGLAVARFLKASRRKRMRSRFEQAANKDAGIGTVPVTSVSVPIPGFPGGGAPEFPQVTPSHSETFPGTQKP